MSAIEYLDGLIAGLDMGTSIPIQKSELAMLKALIVQGQMKVMSETIAAIEKSKG